MHLYSYIYVAYESFKENLEKRERFDTIEEAIKFYEDLESNNEDVYEARIVTETVIKDFLR